ncbi:MAG: hypothetical protein GXO09_06290 [Crenarchaeota archaeon]|nr:hypothetical protein [Thermoproteota archaeon]
MEAIPASLLLGRLALLALPLAAAGLLMVFLLLGVFISGVLELAGRRCGSMESGVAAGVALAPGLLVLVAPGALGWLLLPVCIAAAALLLRRLCMLPLADSLLASLVVVAAWGGAVLTGLLLRGLILHYYP